MDIKYALLLTACINPKPNAAGKDMVKRRDPLVRLADYKASIKFWLNYNDPRIRGIVFVENSGYDLSSLQAFANSNNQYKRNVEFLQFPASAIPDGLHYGYSELEMIDYAFTNSQLIQSSDSFIKTTGRLYFPKLSKLLDKISLHCDFASDARDYSYKKISKHYVITTLFVVQKEFYKKVLHNTRLKMLSIGESHIETLYYYILKPMYTKSSQKVILRFPFNVDPVGVGAHWNTSYNSFRKKSESFVRSIFRIVAPSLWI